MEKYTYLFRDVISHIMLPEIFILLFVIISIRSIFVIDRIMKDRDL